MSSPTDEKIDLEFSQKYDHKHAQHYLEKHQKGLARRLSSWRDIQIARKALILAGNPKVVLDLPCGAGRFWPMLAELPEREIMAADNSQGMVDIAMASQPPTITQNVKAFQTSAFDIKLPDSAVDCIFSMRLMHHIGESQHRHAMLREFHRVTRDTVVLSLWVDGNYKGWKRKRSEARRHQAGYQNRFIFSQHGIENEFREAGFDVVDHVDFLPLYAMWRVYILRKKG